MATEIATLALLAAVIVVGAAWPRVHTPSDVHTTTVRIETGQTLWTIAAAHPVDGLTTQQNVDLIASLNGLRGTLSTGSVIRVPNQAGGSMVAMR